MRPFFSGGPGSYEPHPPSVALTWRAYGQVLPHVGSILHDWRGKCASQIGSGGARQMSLVRRHQIPMVNNGPGW
jgi:hypothetical protein